MTRYFEPMRQTLFAGISWGGFTLARHLKDAKPILEIGALVLSMAVSIFAILSWWQTYKLQQLERKIRQRELSKP